MKLLIKTFTISSNHSCQDVMATLNKNIEPWHKDSSKLRYEGHVNDDGTFMAKPCPESPHSRSRKPEFTGAIEETETGCRIHITFRLPQAIASILLIAYCALLVAGVLIWFKIIKTGLPWYGPFIFVPLSILITYFNLNGERKQVIEDLKRLLC